MQHTFWSWLIRCKYEVDLANIVEDTEQTQFCPQMDGQGETSALSFNFIEVGV